MGEHDFELTDLDLDAVERDEDVPDPSEQLDQLQADDTLIDRGVDDVLDEGVVTADRWSPAERFGTTAAEQRRGPSLDEWLAQEEPDVGSLDDAEDSDEIDEDDLVHEVGRSRSGRLTAVAADGDDPASDVFGVDVGIDGGAASAEEAAMHVIDEQDDLLD